MRVISSYFFLIAVLCYGQAFAVPYIYPVSMDHYRDITYVLHQPNASSLELWVWSVQTKRAEQLLFSHFIPAGFGLLPSGNGFSFIDKGVLKIKHFVKRSPRTIEFDAPIYNVELVHWLEDELCYTSAKLGHHFGIFTLDYDGVVSPVCLNDNADCLYPQKVGDDCFYIERDAQLHYRIMKTPFVVAPYFETFQERKAWYIKQEYVKQELIDFHDDPVIFLRMLSESEGFAIGHSKKMSKRDEQVSFDYYHLIKANAGWRVKTLFSFDIPARFLFMGYEERLYESILPLLPCHDGYYIFYVSTLDDRLALFSYDMITRKSLLQLHDKQTSYFVPMRIGKQLYCGGTSNDTISLMPKAQIHINLCPVNPIYH